MNTRDLHAIWNAPDNSRLTAKQYTVRLPIRVAAQLAALNEMYPRKTMTDLIGDLLAAGLDQLAEDLPTKNVGEKPLGFREDGEAEWEQIGPGVTFAQLSQKYLKEFESEEATKGNTEKPAKKIQKPAGTREDRKAKR
ncbi:MAG TPA: hypothetical protein PK614_00245 [Nitrospira sp.]|nr:hypothetical protein [Nitrospira sp.]